MTSILLMNTSFKNRGDALMIEAVMRRMATHAFSVAADLAYASPPETRAFPIVLLSTLPRTTLRRRVFDALIKVGNGVASPFLQVFGERTRLRRLSDIDLALDLSGYCFGDHWGQAKIDAAKRGYMQLRRAGAKVVLMPRTWGPFETIDPASLNEMFDQVELAFARDKQSLGLLESRLSVINRRKLFFAPDYTHEVLPVNVRHGEPSEIAYLIPSRRVIDSGTLSRSRYLQLFELARVHLLSRGIRAKILIHEVEGDMAFIPEFREMGIPDSDIVVPPDALSAKALISEASLIVTSRLHGLYNALNCEIPVAVIAWSFKYKEALDQYGCSECLVDISRPEESLGDILDMLTTPERADALRTQMAEGKLKSGSASEAMWRRIHALAENVTPAELR